jgi:cytochrome b
MVALAVPGDDAQPVSTVVWDLPVRIVHWGFVALLPALWWTAENNHLGWHMTLGEIMLGLVVFRILWGVCGSSTARFSTFVAGPRAIIAYLCSGRKGAIATGVGHNPLGALSVIAMLAVLLSQVALGLVSGDPDDGATGPLNHLVGYATALAATEWHEIGFNVILGLVALHVLAIGYYLAVRRDNLVRPMITGRRILAAPVLVPPVASARRAIFCAGIAAAIALWLASGAPTELS